MNERLACALGYCVAVWFVCSSLYRAGRAYSALRKRPAPETRRACWKVWIAPGGSVAGALLLFIAVLRAGRAFTPSGLLPLAYAIAGSLLFASLADLYVAWTRGLSAAPVSRRSLANTLVFVALTLAACSIAFYVKSVPGSRDGTALLTFPARSGTWRVIAGGRSSWTNYHHENPAAPNYAADFVRSDGETGHAPLFAPLSGEVVEAIGDRGNECPEPEGNVVRIKAGDRTEVLMAHLEPGSVVVKRGDHVTTGQPVARCGGSGSATAPHLHMHAERNGRPVPMLFEPGRRFPVRGDLFIIR